MWSERRDSNSQPSPWEGDALPLSHFRIEFFYNVRLCKSGKVSICIFLEKSIDKIKHFLFLFMFTMHIVLYFCQETIYAIH